MNVSVSLGVLPLQPTLDLLNNPVSHAFSAIFNMYDSETELSLNLVCSAQVRMMINLNGRSAV